MRGTLIPSAPSRIRGKDVILRHIRRAVLACHRYATHRARGHADIVWAAATLDGLTAVLERAEQKPGGEKDIPTRVAPEPAGLQRHGREIG